MHVENKASRFVEKLWESFTPDYADESTPQVEIAFVEVVSNLPDGKLKNELARNIGRYKIQLSKLRKKHVAEQPSGALSVAAAKSRNAFPYNLLVAGEPILNEAVVNSTTLEAEEKRRLASMLTHKAAHRLSSTNTAFTVLLNSQASAVDKSSSFARNLGVVEQLLAALSTVEDGVAVQKLMAAFLRHLQPLVDDCLSATSKIGLRKLLHVVSTFLLVVELKCTDQLPSKPPHYDDLLVALLSCYVDLVVASADADEREAANGNSADEAKVIRAGERIASRVCYSLTRSQSLCGRADERHPLGLDVLLQITPPTEAADGCRLLLLPLYRLLLESTEQGLLSSQCEIFVKYVCATRMAKDIGGDRANDLMESARKVAAPVGLIKWLRNKDQSIFDEMPDDKNFAGVNVTRFLLDDASDDLAQNILEATCRGVFHSDLADDLVPSIVGATGKPAYVTEDKPVAASDSSEGQPLFFIDTRHDESLRKMLDANLTVHYQEDDDAAAVKARDLLDKIALLEQETTSETPDVLDQPVKDEDADSDSSNDSAFMELAAAPLLSCVSAATSQDMEAPARWASSLPEECMLISNVKSAGVLVEAYGNQLPKRQSSDDSAAPKSKRSNLRQLEVGTGDAALLSSLPSEGKRKQSKLLAVKVVPPGEQRNDEHIVSPPRQRSASESSNCSYTLRSQTKTVQQKKTVAITSPKNSRRKLYPAVSKVCKGGSEQGAADNVAGNSVVKRSKVVPATHHLPVLKETEDTSASGERSSPEPTSYSEVEVVWHNNPKASPTLVESDVSRSKNAVDKSLTGLLSPAARSQMSGPKFVSPVKNLLLDLRDENEAATPLAKTLFASGRKAERESQKSPVHASQSSTRTGRYALRQRGSPSSTPAKTPFH